MKYMMLIYLDEKSLSDSQREHCYKESAEYAQQINANGQYLLAAPLHPTSTATSVRTREGKRLVTDGPFAETREQLGGFFFVDAQDLGDAIPIPSQIPARRWGTVENRPGMEGCGLPQNPRNLFDSLTF